MEFGGGFASPRISFSRDFVEVDAVAATGSAALEDAAGKRFYSSDFEFAMAACFDTPQKGCASAAAMLPADELISHGILLPFEPSRGRHSVSGSASRQILHPHVTGSESASPPSLTPSRSYPSSLRESSPPLSPKAPNCGAKWREFLGLKAKPDDPCPAKPSSSSSSSKIMKLFYRSRSVGSPEVDHHLTIPSRPSLSSISRSSSHTSSQEQFLGDSSLPESGGCWTDPEIYTGSAARLWMRGDGRQARSKIKGSGGSPGRSFPSGSPGRRSISKSLSSVRDGDEAAAGRMAARNSKRDDFVRNSKIHEQRRNVRWGEQWRLADSTIAYSKVRVAPVLLNVPACIAPSLRGARVTKTGLTNPRHLLPPKKTQHSKLL